MSKRVGMDRVFLVLEGLLSGFFKTQIQREIPQSCPARPHRDICVIAISMSSIYDVRLSAMMF